MFFEKERDAILNAKLETLRTHRKHRVVPCVKYVCNKVGDFRPIIGAVPGFTIVLTGKGKNR